MNVITKIKVFFLLTIVSYVFFVACTNTAEVEVTPFVCEDSLGCTEIGVNAPVKIGVLQVLSGEVGPIGSDQVRGIELAVADHGGTIAGHAIELQVEDSLCSPEGGTTSALRLVADSQIVAVIGTTCSGSAATAIEVISEKDLVLVSGVNTAPSLTSIAGEVGTDYKTGYFRVAPNDIVTGRAAAVFAYQELGVRKAATIDGTDPFTEGLAAVFRQEFENLGGEIVLKSAVNKGDTDMIPVLTAIAESDAELVFFATFEPEGNHIVRQVKQLEDLQDLILMSGESLFVQSFIDDVGEDALGMYFVLAAVPKSEGYEGFLQRYEDKFEERPSTVFSVQAYDATKLLINAIETVALTDGDSVYIGHQALRDALHNTTGLEAITGILNCDEYGDCSGMSFEVYQLEDIESGLDGLRENVVFTFTPNE